MSNDFRLNADMIFQGKEFVYGLPEVSKEEIKSKLYCKSRLFCHLYPVWFVAFGQSKKLENDIHINATTGATGAGVSPSANVAFSMER